MMKGIAILTLASAVVMGGAWGGEEAAMKPTGEKMVRKTYGDGRWFPGNAKELARDVEGYINAAEVPAVTGRIVSAIAPHAGYQYSGKVAGHTFRAIRDAAKAGRGPQTVVILGFSHRGDFRGIALMDGEAIRSPLGETPLDRASADFLVKKCGRAGYLYPPHVGEHSAENEIPFVQTALPGVPLVVGLIGDHDLAGMRELADALVELSKTRRILVVASTDMLHDSDYRRVTDTDKITVDQFARLDTAALMKRWSYEVQVCCGIAPVGVAMLFAEKMGSKQGTVLRYRNSGDDHPESRGNWVVGYGSVVFTVPE
jgi:MEMO1 family protein